MTKKQKLRRNSFAAGSNAREDDFILADLDVMPDEEEPSPVPLNHFLDDEETIDRLLVTTGFDANDELDDDRGPDAVVIDDIDLADDFSDFDQFAVGSVEPAEQNQQAETKEIPVSDIHSMADFDELPDALMIDDTSRGNGFGISFKGQDAMAADADMFDPEESEAVLDKDAPYVLENPETAKRGQATVEIKPELALNKLNNPGTTEVNPLGLERENINDYENRVKKAAIITYTSLGFGIAALLSTVVMGVIVSNVQTKVSKLTELVSILEEDMGSIAEKNPDLEINNSAPSIGQLNQKANGLPERLEEQTRYSSGVLENGMVAEVTKQATANKSIDNQKATPPVPEKQKPSGAAVNKLSADNKNLLVKQPQSSADASKNKMTAVATKPATVIKSNDKLKTRTPALAKKKLSGTAVKKASAEKKANKTQAAASWSVNLTAYQNLSDAKSKAEKFSQKGIPVKVIAVNMNNTKWYRLKVGGFKNKGEATAYAAKIKKSLNLNSVSVGSN